MEENQNASKPLEIYEETLDSTSHKKHTAMIERLSKLHQSRLEQSSSRKSSDSISPPSFESTKSFLDRFSETKKSIETDLDRCRLIAQDPESGSQLRSDLNTISISIADLEKLVAENSYFLPSYEVRSSLKSIADLKETLETASAELLPRKKFAFRNKSARKVHSSLANVAEFKDSDAVSATKPNLEIRDSPGFRNKEAVVLVKRFMVSEEGDFTLSNLDSCEINLKGRLRTLFVHRLKNCKVLTGPVLGSILIEKVENCFFMLASHQIRIHEAKATDFYLRVRSRPIIEDSNGVRFAPYDLFYEGIVEELRESGLGEETGNWANVDDFRWLRAVQSPNWSILPEEERVCTVNISDTETPFKDL